MKYIHTFESFVTEGISQEAYSIHSVTQCGQDAAQNFIDDNNIDAKKLADYVKQHSRSKEKYDVRDMIKDPKSNSMLLKQFIKESVVNEDFPGPGETVLAKDITPSVLDYFDRTNKKLLIDTKTKKGITGEVGRMYNDLVFNGDTIQLKDIIQVKILESTNEAQNFNVKDLPKGAVLTFNDGETWMVTKVIGNSSNPQGYLLAPHGKTKEYYISLQIEFSIKKLEDDLVAVN